MVGEEILEPLDFSDLDQCVACIKGKFAKTIKKNAKRSSGVLELIHTDICGPFSVKTVDGFDSFITFKMILHAMVIFIQSKSDLKL